MRCIFCKQDSSSSKTIEHIVPESLGNGEHTLPIGVVCSKCNNYFGLKVEKPLLDSDYFRQARFRNVIFNKEGRIPTIQGLLLPEIVPIEILREQGGQSIFPSRERDIPRFVHSFQTNREGELIIPAITSPDHNLMSRFLAKAALEVLTFKTLKVEGALDEIIDKPELDTLREYARYGASPAYWPFSTRPIYSERKLFIEGNERYEVLHEFDLLYTKSSELYLVIAIFGIEYVINMAERETDGYFAWLKEHGFESPLYVGWRSSLR
jgi:hypothetical protein